LQTSQQRREVLDLLLTRIKESNAHLVVCEWFAQQELKVLRWGVVASMLELGGDFVRHVRAIWEILELLGHFP
jgi:hypothetical protein